MHHLFTSIIIITCAIIFSAKTYANDSNHWAEFGITGAGDLIGSQVNLKTGNNDTNWALELGHYEISGFGLTSTRSRETGDYVERKVTAIGITKNWTITSRFSYLEMGIGLGAVKGNWENNCEKVVKQGYFYNSTYDICDITEGVRPGIPLHASAVFGKYVGIGISLKAFITNENAHAGLMFMIPLGDFTK